MKTSIAILILSIALIGCSKNQATAVHLGTQGNWNPFIPTVADGCHVGTEGDLTGVYMTYVNGDCEVVITGGGALPE